MEYFIVFLEGIVSFISPCILPMIPIYISYFAGQKNDTKKTLLNSIGFVLGFTIIFTLLGLLSGTLGVIIRKYHNIINIAFGIIIILFGLNYMGLVKLNILNKNRQINANIKKLTFFSSMIFGIAFAASWTPCIGAFLGTALLLVTSQGEIVHGLMMLLLFSLGLGIPFLITSILIEKLKGTFEFIKRNYSIINKICGVSLVLMGILMMTGILP